MFTYINILFEYEWLINYGHKTAITWSEQTMGKIILWVKWEMAYVRLVG